jgi:WD40 repeat protein
MLSVYISSTYGDLVLYRQAVIAALGRMNYRVVSMEQYGAADQRPLQRCLQDVDACDVYVGLFAWRYGYIPTEQNPAGKSITELEYRQAHQASKPCLIFLLHENQPWPPPQIDRDADGQRMLSLRQELSKDWLVSFFRTPDDLAASVITALHNLETNLPTRKKSQQEQVAKREPVVEIPAGLKRTFAGHSEPVECVAISPNGQLGVSGGWDRTVRVWSLENGMLVRTLTGHVGTVTHPGVVHGVLFTADSRTVVSCGYDGTIRFWDVASGRQLRSLTGHIGAVTSIAISADGRRLISGGADRTIRVWDLENWRETQCLKGPAASVQSVALTADGQLALSGGRDGQLRLWDLRAAREVPRFRKPGNVLFSVDLTADGQLALSADLNGLICLWDVNNGLEVRRFVGHSDAVRRALLSKDLRRVLTGGNDGTMRVWDLQAATEIARFDDHHAAVTSVALSPDGSTAISAAPDRLVRLWSLPR